MDTTTGFRRNPDAQEKAYVLAELANMEQRRAQDLATIRSAIEVARGNVNALWYEARAGSSLGKLPSVARSHKLQVAVETAVRRFATAVPSQLSSLTIVVQAKFPGHIAVGISEKLWRRYSEKAIKRLTR